MTWITEYYGDVGLSLRTRGVLFTARSAFQLVEIVDTVPYGRALLLDGALMTTEGDEFVYHEMIAHVPLLAHASPRRILVIGGGDGGVVREILKHGAIQSVVLCEIDEMVIDASRTYLPSIAAGLGDPRVSIVVDDGASFLKRESGMFDVIIVDSTDPIGPGEALFTSGFYRDVHAALAADGILVAQTASPFLAGDVIRRIYPILDDVFPLVRMYTAPIPTYPSGYWSWAFCSTRHGVGIHPSRLEAASAIESTCRYYGSDVHEASFVLPRFARALLRS